MIPAGETYARKTTKECLTAFITIYQECEALGATQEEKDIAVEEKLAEVIYNSFLKGMKHMEDIAINDLTAIKETIDDALGDQLKLWKSDESEL
jgi:hypothetical protein